MRKSQTREVSIQDSGRHRHPVALAHAVSGVGNAVGEGVCFARSRSGDDEQWWSDMTVAADAVLDGSALLRIKRLKI